MIEAALVTVIIGVGVMSMLQLLAAGTVSNSESSRLTTAVQLANNINEWAVRTKYADLRTTIATGAGRTFNPPVSGMGTAMIKPGGASAFPGWKQIVTVKYVNPDNVTFTVPDAQLEPVSRITVEVTKDDQQVYRTSWLMAAGEWPPP